MPADGRPGRAPTFTAVPSQTWESAKLMVAAMPGSIAWWQLLPGTARSLPSAPTTRVMATGSQKTPFAANAANAAAMVSGAIESLPITFGAHSA